MMMLSALTQKSNTTNSSWSILHIQPTHNGHTRIRIPPTEVGGYFRSCQFNASKWAGSELSTNCRL